MKNILKIFIITLLFVSIYAYKSLSSINKSDKIEYDNFSGDLYTIPSTSTILECDSNVFIYNKNNIIYSIKDGTNVIYETSDSITNIEIKNGKLIIISDNIEFEVDGYKLIKKIN